MCGHACQVVVIHDEVPPGGEVRIEPPQCVQNALVAVSVDVSHRELLQFSRQARPGERDVEETRNKTNPVVQNTVPPEGALRIGSRIEGYRSIYGNKEWT